MYYRYKMPIGLRIIIGILLVIVCLATYSGRIQTYDDNCEHSTIDTEEPISIEPKTDEITEEPTTNRYYVVDCSSYEVDLLAATIYHEAGGSECTDRHQQLVAQVVINRVLNNKFPDTIYGVVTQNGQYNNYGRILSLAKDKSKIPQRCYNNALLVLYGEIDCPSNVIWQAEFIQGEIYETYHTPYSTTYFCY